MLSPVALIQKSHIHEYLSTKKNQGAEAPADDFAGKPLYRLFGYFSILGLLRVHVLLGDFTLALAVMDGFDLKAMLSPATRMHAVHAAHVSALYHVGFCYLMLNRWTDAIDVLSRGVSYFYKNRRFTSGADQVAKTVDRMLAMIAIAHSFVPSLRLEDWIKSGVDKFGDGPHRINRGSYASGQSADELLSIYEDLFIRAAPKFVSPTPPALDAAAAAAANGDQESESGSNSGASTTDPTKHQLSLFLADIKPLLPAHDMRSFLRLYTTVSTEKLASLLNRNEEEVAQELAVVNGASRCPKWTEGSLLSGEAEPISDLAFQIEDGNVRISESKRQRQVADYFYRRFVLQKYSSLPVQALTIELSPAERSRQRTPCTSSSSSLCQLALLSPRYRTTSSSSSSRRLAAQSQKGKRSHGRRTSLRLKPAQFTCRYGTPGECRRRFACCSLARLYYDDRLCCTSLASPLAPALVWSTPTRY